MGEQKRILITSALPYVNNVPHLGNIIGCVLSADVFARFARSFGYETLFVCGVDEHGTTTETKARMERLTPKQLCDKYFAIHKQVYEWFGCSFDCFGRTSDPVHHEVTQELFKAVHAKGFIVEEEVEQLYSEASKTFLADRFVEGTCPHCGYEAAKGDQCERCSRVLNATELINPKSTIDGSTPIIKRTRHLFLDLPKLQPRLERWVEQRSKEGLWTANAIQQTRSWFNEGLTLRAITRDLHWGVPVPLEGFEQKVFYVWFDAPIGYISITKREREDWRRWWCAPDQVRLYQFMAKDNIPFHTILFPATLLAADAGHTMLYHINSSEYLNYESGKFSKSRGEGVFGDDAMTSGIPADVWRYYLLINRPETGDATFVWEDFAEKLNHELVATLGNLINRTLVFIKKYYAGKVPEGEPSPEDLSFLEQIQTRAKLVSDQLHKVEIKEALRSVMQIARMGNQYFQAAEPWRTQKESPLRAQTSLFILANLVKDLAILIEPFMPATAASIVSQLAIEVRGWSDLGALTIEPGHVIADPAPLFSKIDEKQVQAFKQRFAGTREERKPTMQPSLAVQVATITKVEPHPDADKLFIEQLSLGDESRQIVSGLAGHYSPEQLVGRKILLVANLRPAKLRGVLSEGMLLAGEADGQVEVLFVDEAREGEFVLGSADSPQITIDQFAKHEIVVRQGRVEVDGERLCSSAGPITTEQIIDGMVH